MYLNNSPRKADAITVVPTFQMERQTQRFSLGLVVKSTVVQIRVPFRHICVTGSDFWEVMT